MIKKILLLLIIFTATAHTNIYADIANDITSGCKIDSNLYTACLFDKSYSTGYTLNENDHISITSHEGIGYIYILWQSHPDSWSLTVNNKPLFEFNKNEGVFLHQLIKITDYTNNIDLFINKNSCKIDEIYVFGNGSLPDWVQNWELPYKKADMLLISTHADDEHIFFGGTMPYYAGELGLRLQVAYLTNHYNYRLHELLNGLWEVGIRKYPVISDFCDYYSETLIHAKSIYDEKEILRFQVELLRRFKPYVVLGHDLNGEYGHGVHMLNAHTLAAALEISDDKAYFSDSAHRYGVWDVPKCYLHLYSKNKLSMNWDIPLKNFDNKTAFEMAISGFSKHISQQEYFSVGKKGVFDCRAFGLYRSTVGKDIVKNDFFENINIKHINTINNALDYIN